MKTSVRPRNAFYAQSGGVTAVINASACGVIETARKHKRHIGTVYAGRNGILGALHEDLIDTSKESAADIRALRHTPARRLRLRALQAQEVRGQPARVRAPDRGLPGARHRLLLLQRRRRLGRHLPQGVAAGRASWAIRCRPSTCRRRWTTTCRSPTAARASARSPSTSPSRSAKPASTSPRWRDLDQGVRAGGHGPARRLDRGGRRPRREEGRRRAAHHPVPRDRVRRGAVPRARQGVRRASTATARSSSPKACSNAEGKFLADAGTRDAFGHAQLGGVGPVVAQLVKDKLGYKYHWAVADYLQRAARHIASKVDVEQAYAVGKAAVEFAVKGHNSVMPTIVRDVEPAVPLEDRHGAARRGRERREDAAARLHHAGRLPHHGEGPAATSHR